MVPYKRPLPNGQPSDGFSPRQFYELGDRLNIDREVLAVGLHMDHDKSIELKESPRGGGDMQVPQIRISPDEDQTTPPFAMVADRTKPARYSEFPTLPAVMAKFKSPFETGVGEGRTDGPTHVFVTTSHTVDRS